MAIWSKLWKQLQNNSRKSYSVLDTEGKFIDILNIMGWKLEDLCKLTEENSLHYLNKIEEELQKINNQLSQQNQSGKNNETKQLADKKFTLLQCEKIVTNKDYLLNYLIEYKNRLKVTYYQTEQGISNIYDFFRISPNATLEELNQAKENLENQAYLLEKTEKNKVIDQINRYYEVIIDPISKNGYNQICENPNVLNILDTRIKTLTDEIKQSKEQTSSPTSTSNEKTTPKEIQQDNQIKIIPMTPTKHVSVTNPNTESINDHFEITELDLNQEKQNSNLTPLQKPTTPPKEKELEYLPNVNQKTLLNQCKYLLNKKIKQKNKIEEQTIDGLDALNRSIQEIKGELREKPNDQNIRTRLALAYLAKNNLINQHQKDFQMNPEYMQTLKDIEILNQKLKENNIIEFKTIQEHRSKKSL